MNVYSELMIKYLNEIQEIEEKYSEEELNIYRAMKEFVSLYEQKYYMQNKVAMLEKEMKKKFELDDCDE